MFTLTYVDHEYETSIPIWEFELMSVLKSTFAFIEARYTIEFTDTNETEFINEILHIKFYMNIDNSNWHN